jgi:DNA-binding CsgD family transcriptional regulator
VKLAQGPEPELQNSAEDVLVDTEVYGFRYLLVRMPQPGRNRVQLSPREQEIVRMVAKGHPNKVIADVLNISSWTVCTHLRRIFAKLGVGSRAAMVAQLLELGVLVADHRGPAKLR